MVHILFLIVLTACQKHGKTESTGSNQVENISATIEHVDPVLSQISTANKSQIPNNLRRGWPYTEWHYAKAFTYNFSPEKKGAYRYVWSDKGWAENIHSTIDLNRHQSAAAMEFIHKTGGELVMSKCPIVPRHSVVFFNDQDQPVGSMNICFSCEDTIIWPKYYQDQETEYLRYRLESSETSGEDVVYLIDEIHSSSISNWKVFFNLIGAEEWSRDLP